MIQESGIEISQKLIDLLTKYNSYRLTIEEDENQTFSIHFISKSDIKKKRETIFTENGITLFPFGDHKTAQFHFYITNNGEIATLETNQLVFICSSIEKFIEQYALQNEIGSKKDYPYYYQVSNNDKLMAVLSGSFTEIPECSNQYSSWYTNGTVTIVKGICLDGSGWFLHIFASKNTITDQLIVHLQKEKYIK